MTRSRFSILFLALVMMMALTTPGSAANKEYQQLMADVRMLQEQVQRQQLAIVQLTDALKAVTTKLDAQADKSLGVLAEQKSAIDAMTGALEVMKEKFIDTNDRLGTITGDVAAISRALAQTGPAGGAMPPPGAAPGQAQPEGLGAQPSAILQQAISDYYIGNYSMAETEFQQYLKDNPKAPSAPEALVYLGQTLRAERKFEEAIVAFAAVIDNYPGSNRLIEALFQRGRTWEEAGDKAKARESYQAVIDKYPPDNTWVLQAAQRLARIK